MKNNIVRRLNLKTKEVRKPNKNSKNINKNKKKMINCINTSTGKNKDIHKSAQSKIDLSSHVIPSSTLEVNSDN